MTAQDAADAEALAAATLPAQPDADRELRRRWMQARMLRLVGTDPDGCRVACDEQDRVTGVSLALVRDGIWALSLLAVAPDRQERGVGRMLLEASLAHASGARGALIAASTDPRAMHLYATAGFRLHPCVAAAGVLDRRRIPARLRSREAGAAELERAAAIARDVRGGAYDPADLQLYLEHLGGRLLTCADRGFAVAREGSTAVVVARDDATAADLLWSVLASGPPGATAIVDFIAAGQDWAVRTALAAGLVLSPDGPIFSRGATGPLRPFLPSGAFV